MKTGFLQVDRYSPFTIQRVFYMECKGRDISFPRWRIDLYYDLHLAMTHFEENETDYLAFIERHKEQCFDDYTAYKNYLDMQHENI